MATLIWNGETDQLPVHSDTAPWNEIVSLRESRGEEVFLSKMTKALKKNLTRLKKKSRQRWVSESLALEPWDELTSGDEAIRDFRHHCWQQPDDDVTSAAFQAWLESRDENQLYSLWETWHLLSALVLNGAKLPDALFWQVWNLGAEAFQQLRNSLDAPEGAEGELDQFLIAGVELRWLAVAVYPEIEEAAKLPKQARRAFSDWVDGFFPRAGIPDAEDLPRLPLLWRSLARTSLLCDALNEKPFRKSDHGELRKLLSTTCRLAGDDGSLFVSHEKLPWDYLSQLGQEILTKKQSSLQDLLKVYAQSKSPRKLKPPKQKPALQTDESAWAVLRTDWSPEAASCCVLHHDNDVELTLRTPDGELLSGLWNLEVEMNGEVVSADEDWEATCWHSDSDGDYLELEQKLTDDIVIDRQLFLSRRDHFLYLAEIVHAPDDAQLTIRSTLPFENRLKLKQDQYTREWKIGPKKKPAARFFPVGLDQEIVHKTDGGIQQTEDGLSVERIGTGSTYLPMVLDWHRHHAAAPAEWRTLTVTQARQKTPSFEAGAYRLRLADQHLFMYRSLVKPSTPRAILGEHTLNESLIGNFDADGDVLPLLVVEE
ncbi:MAG: hypothetical protein HUJ26_05955 [Planctomycetaceae bacterium]|nr:hypothetical protein [Planctomycetaceae bacterium]